MGSQSQPPLIFAVGYSVRALVEACWYAGIESVAVDHFGDADARTFANDRWIAFSVTESGLLSFDTRNAIQTAATEILRSGRTIVFLLGGGMENLGGAVEQLREIATVLGPTEEQRRVLRDIEFLYNSARRAGIQTPHVRAQRVSDGNWLWKPHSSAGGLKIVRSDIASEVHSGYWQEFIPGEQIGVSCLIGPSRCQILGVTSSFDAADWPGPSEFIYRGSIGPIVLSAASQSQIEYMCNHIRDCTGYCGWLQFDFIRDARGRLWLLECNPRWTAGMEIFLFVCGVNPIRELLAIDDYCTSAWRFEQGEDFVCFAKAVVYATEPIFITDDLIAKLNRMDGVVDRPHAPQLIERGHPIATVRAGLTGDQASPIDAENRARLLKEIQKRAEQLAAFLLGTIGDC